MVIVQKYVLTKGKSNFTRVYNNFKTVFSSNYHSGDEMPHDGVARFNFDDFEILLFCPMENRQNMILTGDSKKEKFSGKVIKEIKQKGFSLEEITN